MRPTLDRQELLDTYARYEKEATQAEANARRLRNRMLRIAIVLIGTESQTRKHKPE